MVTLHTKRFCLHFSNKQAADKFSTLSKNSDVALRRFQTLRQLYAGRKANTVGRLKGYFTPLDLGAWNGSPDSGDLNAMVKLGLVQRRRRGTLANMSGSRGSFRYKITKKGVTLYEYVTKHKTSTKV